MIIRITNTVCTIEKEKGDADAPLRALKKDLQVYGPNFQFTSAYKTYRATAGKHGWNGKVNLLESGRFATGLLPRVMEKLDKKWFTRVTIKDERFLKQITGIPTTGVVMLRDYQKDACAAGLRNMYGQLWWPRGVLHLATGGGKTEIAIALTQALGVPTLFIVDKKSLLHQTAQRFNKNGITCGMIGDGIWDVQNCTISTIQTLSQNLDKLGFLEDIEQVFFDEAHHIASTIQKGNTFVRIGNYMPKAYMRWGLTATPFMKDTYSNLLLEGATGTTLYKEQAADLIKKGYLTPPDISMIFMNKDNEVPDVWPDCYDIGIVHNDVRNERIYKEAMSSDPPCLILVTRIPHGERLQKLFGGAVQFLSGDDSQDEREKAIAALVSGNTKALIATTIFDEGMDIPEIKTLIIAGGGRSPVKSLQRLGRGLRRAEGKNKVTVIDFMDYTTNTLRKHSRARKMIWENEGHKIKTTK